MWWGRNQFRVKEKRPTTAFACPPTKYIILKSPFLIVVCSGGQKSPYDVAQKLESNPSLGVLLLIIETMTTTTTTTTTSISIFRRATIKQFFFFPSGLMLRRSYYHIIMIQYWGRDTHLRRYSMAHPCLLSVDVLFRQKEISEGLSCSLHFSRKTIETKRFAAFCALIDQ